MKSMKMTLLLVACVFAFAALISAPAVFSQAEDEYVGSKSCGMCHKDEKAQWDKHKHASVETGCESCHGPGQKHAALGAKKLVELQKEKGDMMIVIDKKPEACGVCHKLTEDKSITMFSDFLVNGQQQYTEMLYNKKTKFKVTCLMCHDSHANTSTDEGIKRECLDCHRGKFKVEIKIAAMADLSCESCHMPYADRNAADKKIGEYHKGDVRSHIFGISTDPDYKLNAGSGKAALNGDGFARLTVEQTCYACHKTGEAHDMNRKEMLSMAQKVH